MWKVCILALVFVSCSDAFLLKSLLGRCSGDELMKNPANDVEPSCLAAADSGSCGFYDCFERRYPCGECGFSKEYGTYNCQKFFLPAYYNRFNDAGKRWVNATGQCLLRVLKGIYTQETASCRMIKQTMIDHVSACYLDNGVISFCDIFWDNKDVLYGVYEAGDFLSSKTVLGEVLQIAGSCTGGRISEIRTDIQGHITRIIDRIGEAASSFGNWLSDRINRIGK